MSPTTLPERTRSVIGEAFTRARDDGRSALVPFFSCGYPVDVPPIEVLRMLADEGADVIELGVPFSDPLADGPVIQHASFEAIKHGMTTRGVLDIVRDFRRESAVPVVLFTYLNPLLRYGVDAFVADAAEAGVDGVLLTDLPPGADLSVEEALRTSSLDWIRLVAPTTSGARLPELLGDAEGFVYAIARRGVTGGRTEFGGEVDQLVRSIRGHTSLPVAVGFGVSRPEDVRRVARVADGVVVGSALVDALRDGLPEAGRFVRTLRDATRHS